MDEHGDLFGAESRSWFGGTEFWRDGHIFSSYPRHQSKLRLNVTPWRTNVTASIEIRNPNVHRVAPWIGRPLPQTNSVAGMQVVLRELMMRTNGGPKKRWETPARFWEPVFEFRQEGAEVTGWDAPQWTAEDPTGNYGRFLGVHQRVLKYLTTFYPAATNLENTKIIAQSCDGKPQLQPSLEFDLPVSGNQPSGLGHFSRRRQRLLGGRARR